MNVTSGGVGDRSTTTVRICRECAGLGLESVTVEHARYHYLHLIAYACALKHLQFEALDPAPTQRPSKVAA